MVQRLGSDLRRTGTESYSGTGQVQGRSGCNSTEERAGSSDSGVRRVQEEVQIKRHVPALCTVPTARDAVSRSSEAWELSEVKVVGRIVLWDVQLAWRGKTYIVTFKEHGYSLLVEKIRGPESEIPVIPDAILDRARVEVERIRGR